MICKPCCMGADLITDSPAVTDGLFLAEDIARSLHTECKGCDCQHNVDAQIQGKAIR